MVAATDGQGPTQWQVISSQLRAVQKPRVAVLNAELQTQFVDRIRRAFPTTSFTQLASSESNSASHTIMAASGPFDLIIDVAVLGVRKNYELNFLHLRPGAKYVVRIRNKARPPAIAELDSIVTSLRSVTPETPRFPKDTEARTWVRLSEASADVARRKRFLMARCTIASLPKLSDEIHNQYLAYAPNDGRVILKVPSSETTAINAVRSSAPLLRPWGPAMTAPELSIREHFEVFCQPNQGLSTGRVALSESFRHVHRRPLRNIAAFRDFGPNFIAVPELTSMRLPGRWFHLDTEISNHFGHAIAEQISHLWAWPAMKTRYPDLMALVFTSNPSGNLAQWQLDLLDAAGVPASDLHIATSPVIVDSLITSSAAYSIGEYVHPLMAEVYSEIGSKSKGSRSAGRAPARSSGRAVTCRFVV